MNLAATAISKFQASLASNWFALGFADNSELTWDQGICLRLGGTYGSLEVTYTPTDMVKVGIHRIMELDEIDDGTGADWYVWVGLDDGFGFNWQQSSEPIATNLNHLVVDEIYSFPVTS